jgi:hypothetical protein
MATDVMKVTMTDGRVVEFAGKRKVLKEIIVDGEEAGVRFDYINGETRMYWVPKQHMVYSAGHGYGQKLGDYLAGAKDDQGNPIDVEDMPLLTDELHERLCSGDWRAVAEGTGVGGGSIIIKAMMEATGRPLEWVKEFLQGKLDAAAADGKKLTRQALYQSLRISTKLKPIIARLEAEKAAKSKNLIDGDALLDGVA